MEEEQIKWSCSQNTYDMLPDISMYLSFDVTGNFDKERIELFIKTIIQQFKDEFKDG